MSAWEREALCSERAVLSKPPVPTHLLPFLAPGWARAKPGACRLFPSLTGAVWAKKILEAWKYLTSFRVVVPRVLSLCSFSLFLLDAVSPPGHLSHLSHLVPASLPLLLPSLWGRPFLHSCWLKSYPFKTQLSASYSTTASPIQQLSIHSPHHSLTSLPVQGQTVCQVLGYRDQPDPGSAFESFSEQ